MPLPDGTFVAGGSAGASFGLTRTWGDNSPPDYALGSATAVYINMVYQQLLDRPVEQTSLTGWLNWLGQGASRTQLVAAIEQSQEYRTRLVDSFYTTILGRPADPSGEAGFVNALDAGMTVEQVKALILGSPEYYQDHGGTVSSFLQALYHDALNRPIDPGGLADWTGALTHFDRVTVATLILASTEARQDLVQSDYTEYLHRPADSAGLTGWLAQFQQGMSDQILTAYVMGSDEFLGRM